MLADCSLLNPKQLGNLQLRQPYGLVFKSHVQPNGLVRLIHDNLVLARGHLILPFMHNIIPNFSPPRPLQTRTS